MIFNKDIHIHFQNGGVRDLIATSFRDLFYKELDLKEDDVQHTLPVMEWAAKKLEATIKISQEKLEIIKKKMALRETLKLLNWEEHDVSAYTKLGDEKFWMPFIGTEDEYEAFTQNLKIEKQYIVKKINDTTAYICTTESTVTGDKVLSAMGPEYNEYKVFTVVDKPAQFRGFIAGVNPDVNQGNPISLPQYTLKINMEVGNIHKVTNDMQLDRNDFECKWVNVKGQSSLLLKDVNDEDDTPIIKGFIK